jgi:hypothetical protein
MQPLLPESEWRIPPMVLALKILILLAVLLLIGFPYFRKPEEGEGTVTPQRHRQRELLSQKESAYAAIKELDFDYRMGKLSDEDYKALRTQYEQQAISLLKQLDELGASSAGRGKS